MGTLLANGNRRSKTTKNNTVNERQADEINQNDMLPSPTHCPIALYLWTNGFFLSVQPIVITFLTTSLSWVETP